MSATRPARPVSPLDGNDLSAEVSNRLALVLREQATDLPSTDRSSGDIGRAEASAIDTSPMLRPATVAETAELFDPIACLDDRVRRSGRPIDSADPGCFIEIQGISQALLIALGSEITHIGRGLGAGLHLNESSVSRRHAIIVQRPSGHRILDDRSLNGTFVNGRRVEQHDLHDGDVIMLGRVALRYVSHALPPAVGEAATDAAPHEQLRPPPSPDETSEHEYLLPE